MNYWLVAASLFLICNLNHAYGTDGLGRSPLVTIIGMLPVIAVALFVAIFFAVRWLIKLIRASRNKSSGKLVTKIKKNKSKLGGR
jgi:phosphotransferase system  glucose/maltose/N-acetylglucosamine-specific IIC component